MCWGGKGSILRIRDGVVGMAGMGICGGRRREGGRSGGRGGRMGMGGCMFSFSFDGGRREGRRGKGKWDFFKNLVFKMMMIATISIGRAPGETSCVVVTYRVGGRAQIPKTSGRRDFFRSMRSHPSPPPGGGGQWASRREAQRSLKLPFSAKIDHR